MSVKITVDEQQEPAFSFWGLQNSVDEGVFKIKNPNRQQRNLFFITIAAQYGSNFVILVDNNIIDSDYPKMTVLMSTDGYNDCYFVRAKDSSITITFEN